MAHLLYLINKKMKNSIINMCRAMAVLIISLVLYSCSSSKEVNQQGNTTIATAIDSSNWVFTALQVRPQTGRSGMVNGVYTVAFTPGKLNIYLPYFGRAYGNADLLSNKSPLDVIFTAFTENKEQEKTNRWRIVFKPADQKEIQSLSFVLFTNGTASLDIILTNRSPISFTGTVTAGKQQ